MSFFDQPQPVRTISDQRVAAWGKQKVQGHDDATYKQQAQQGQGTVTGSAYSAGRGVNKPRYIPGWNPVESKGKNNPNQSTPKKPQINDRGQALPNASGESLQTLRSTPTATGPTNFAKNAPPGLADRVPSSSTTGKNLLNALRGTEMGLPPHLRSPSIAPTEGSTPSVYKSSKHGTRAPPTMNPGSAAKSAKFASKFPCTYDDCDQGFVALKAMKRHKEEVHHYCRFCDEDFEDFDHWLNHKIVSEDHICCRICGEDFRSEAGRDRHERQLHSSQLECKCVGCGHTFDKGSSLIQHIHENQCRDRDNRVSNMVNREILKKQRAQAALHLDALSHTHSNTSQLIAAMQPPEDDEESAGGVPIEPHLLDLEAQEAKEETAADEDDETEKAEEDLIDFSEVSPTTPGQNIHGDFPTLADAANVKGKGKQKSIIDRWNAMTVNDPKAALEWDAPLSVSANDFENFDYRKAIIPGMNGAMDLVPTDWDHRVFKRHAVDNKFHCPFTKCNVASMDVDNLKRHLTSGIHQGTDHRCIKCLRKFKNIQALVAHMESNSERCKIKETDHFGQILSVVSGGFLGVKGRGADGTIKIGALNEVELAEQAAEQRALLPSEDPNYDWNL